MQLADTQALVKGYYYEGYFEGFARTSRQNTANHREELSIVLTYACDTRKHCQRVIPAGEMLTIKASEIERYANPSFYGVEADPLPYQKLDKQEKTGRCSDCGQLVLECRCD